MEKPEGMRTIEKSSIRWEDSIKMDIFELGWGAWNELIWLMIGTGGGLFSTGQRNFHKMCKFIY